MGKIAVKRLAAVEVDPDVSHQHELNAGALRRALGFPVGETRRNLVLTFYLRDREAPVIEEGLFTIYDAREKHPTRSEYRLYYRTPRFSELASPGDLLVLFRDSESGGLQGIVAAQGTAVEHELEQALRAEGEEALRRFIFRSEPEGTPEDATRLVQTILPLYTAPDLGRATREHPLFLEAVRNAVVPPTRQMARAGREIAETIWGRGPTPDEFVDRNLQAETELYFAIEREVGTRALREIMEAGAPDLEATLSWALRLQQSRKSRRGQSLQHHFASLLTKEGIPFTPQCLTERGETPDFIVPGREAYQDPSYPSDRLRMVACKSTIRERWGQILKEADRIPQKYLLTVDPDLTGETIWSMRNAGLVVFLPHRVLEESYAGHPARNLLGTVGELLNNLHAVV